MSIVVRFFEYLAMVYAAAVGVQLVTIFIQSLKGPNMNVRRHYGTAKSLQPRSSVNSQYYNYGTL